MNLPHEAKIRARQAYRAAGLLATTSALLPAFLAEQRRAPTDEREAVRERWVRRWANALLGLFAIDVVVRGDVPPPRSGPPGRLVVANHRSAIDIGVMLSTFGGRMVSRADLAGWPVIGAAARSVGTIFVDRKSKKSGAATIRAIQAALTEGQTIVLFPEGTTFAGDEVRPFHAGAFVAASRAGATIVPAGLAYPATSGAAFVDESFTAHLERLAKSDSTRMGVAVGRPFATTGMRAADVCERAHSEITSLVAEARVLAGP